MLCRRTIGWLYYVAEDEDDLQWRTRNELFLWRTCFIHENPSWSSMELGWAQSCPPAPPPSLHHNLLDIFNHDKPGGREASPRYPSLRDQQDFSTFPKHGFTSHQIRLAAPRYVTGYLVWCSGNFGCYSNGAGVAQLCQATEGEGVKWAGDYFVDIRVWVPQGGGGDSQSTSFVHTSQQY